jgi:hypothetical protein
MLIVLSVSLKEYKGDIDDGVIYKIWLLEAMKVAKA